MEINQSAFILFKTEDEKISIDELEENSNVHFLHITSSDELLKLS